MRYTEIPTDLLVQAGNVLPRLGYQFEQADFSAELKITEDDMFRLLPLIKWLEYIEAVWNREESALREAVRRPASSPWVVD